MSGKTYMCRSTKVFKYGFNHAPQTPVQKADRPVYPEKLSVSLMGPAIPSLLRAINPAKQSNPLHRFVLVYVSIKNNSHILHMPLNRLLGLLAVRKHDFHKIDGFLYKGRIGRGHVYCHYSASNSLQINNIFRCRGFLLWGRHCFGFWGRYYLGFWGRYYLGFWGRGYLGNWLYFRFWGWLLGSYGWFRLNSRKRSVAFG